MRAYRPRLVVMYGASEKKHWESIAERSFPADNILKLESTVIACTLHPTSHGLENEYWTNWGKRLRQEASDS